MNGPGDSRDAGLDRLLSFTIPGRHARGRLVRLGPALGRILAAHNYPPPIRHLLAEALALTALMGGLLKREGSQLTMQAQAPGGAVELMVCDYRDGEFVMTTSQRALPVGVGVNTGAAIGTGPVSPDLAAAAGD